MIFVFSSAIQIFSPLMLWFYISLLLKFNGQALSQWVFLSVQWDTSSLFYFNRLIVFYVFISALFLSVLSNDIFTNLSKKLIAVIIFSFHILEKFI